MNDNHLKILVLESVFNETFLKFLDFHISSGSIKPTSNKIEKNKILPLPYCFKKLMQAPGYHRVRLFPKGSFILNESEKQTFNAVIKELSQLTHPQPKCYKLSVSYWQ